jgi:hypothetical protein
MQVSPQLAVDGQWKKRDTGCLPDYDFSSERRYSSDAVGANR